MFEDSIGFITNSEQSLTSEDERAGSDTSQYNIQEQHQSSDEIERRYLLDDQDDSTTTNIVENEDGGAIMVQVS